MRAAAALRHGGRRGHVAYGDVPARARAGALARRVRAAVAPPEGRPLRRKPQPDAALLPVSGGAETLAAGHPRSLPRLARGARPRPREERRSLRRGRLGEPDAGRVGPRLGSVAERHGDHAVHLFPAGRRPRMQPDHGRDHVRHRAPRDVSAGEGEPVRPRVDGVDRARRHASSSPTATSTTRTRSSSRRTTSSSRMRRSCSSCSRSSSPTRSACSRRSCRSRATR